MNTRILEKNAARLRREIFHMLSSVEQGHPGSLLSQIEILTSLFYGNVMRWEKGNPNSESRDRIIISKGHATMGLYPIFADLDYFDKSELDRFGTFDGILRIFGNISIPGIDATTGSLGHGLGIAIGYAIAAKHDGRDNRVFVIISEGEMYEGSIWESALIASHLRPDNLVLILDRNRKIILGDTEELVRLEPIAEKWEAFGFHSVTVDGHCFDELLEGFGQIGKTGGKPLAIVANTVKGKGIPLMEEKKEWHYWHRIDDKTRESIGNELLSKARTYQ